MKSDKIHKFYKSCHEYLEKKRQIEQMTIDLRFMLDKVNDDLNDTIDNGFQAEYLVQVANEYEEHKFESNVVQEFIDKIDHLLFSKLDTSKKDRLEVVSLGIRISHHHSYNDTTVHINGPVVIDFIDICSDKTFTIYIPVKDSTQTDVLHWTYDGNGLYIVAVDTKKFGAKDICRVFNPSKVTEAIEKLLNGDFDEDLYCIDVSHIFSRKHLRICDKINDIDEYCMSSFLTNTLFINDDLNECLQNNDKCISNCIDDTNDFNGVNYMLC